MRVFATANLRSEKLAYSAIWRSALGKRRADRLDIRPNPLVIIDGSVVRGKARDSKWNGRKCNPNRD